MMITMSVEKSLIAVLSSKIIFYLVTWSILLYNHQCGTNTASAFGLGNIEVTTLQLTYHIILLLLVFNGDIAAEL